VLTPERWQKVRDVLEQALELAPEKRARFLDVACSSDPSMRSEVQSLLSADAQARSSFLESPPVLPAALTPGTRLGDYEIVSQIGSGGMGVVYHARDTRLGREVAIKVLPSHLSADASRLRRFEQEAQSAAALNHPNILAIHQLGSYQAAPYLVSELLEGETLREQLRQGPLSQERTLDYAQQIADGLNAAHERGIIHRDLKPENLFVTKDNRIKILDFGLAKLAERDGDSGETVATLGLQTLPGQVAGTVGYMSPEQVRGEKLDTRTDLFSFGVVLYEMATGKRPFDGDTSGVTFEAILNRQPTPPTKLNTKVPPELERIITKALEKDREVRYQHASDVRADLKRLKRDSESGHTAAYPLTEHTKRKVWWVWAAVVSALVIATGIVIYKRPWARKVPQREVVQRELTANDPENTIWGAAISPNGSQLAYTDSAHGVVLLQIDSGEKRTYPDSKGLATTSWYPDGTHLLVVDLPPGHAIWKMSMLDGSRKKIVELDDSVGAGLSPDGQTIAVLKTNSLSELWTMSAEGQELVRIIDVAPSKIEQFSWSPTSQRIAYLRYGRATNGNYELAIESCNRDGSGKKGIVIEPRLQMQNGFGDLEWLSDNRLVYALAEAAPNEKYDNLWSTLVDPTTGEAMGAETQITRGIGISHFNFSASMDAKRMVFRSVVTSETAFFAPLNGPDGKLGSPIPIGAERWERWPAGWTADSRSVFYISNVQGKWGLYQQEIADSDSRLVLSLPDGYSNLVVTADGEWILSILTSHDERGRPSSRKLMRVPLRGGPPFVMDHSQINNFRCASRTTICVISELQDGRTTFTFLDPVRGRGAEFGRADGAVTGDWALSPDGRRIAYVPRENGSEIRFISVDGKTTAPISFGNQFLQSVAWSADQNFLYISGRNDEAWYLGQVSFDGKTKTLLRVPDGQKWIWLGDISPDGHYISYSERTFESNLNLLENF
jgi:eukaryotic-like serine/threonine-protein kinase